MKLKEISEILDASTLSQGDSSDVVVDRAYCADLMSDVLAFSLSNSLLVTHLTNAQVVRTAHVADLKAIVFCEGKRPDQETINLAEKKHIPLLTTVLTTFDACGILFEKGLRGTPDRECSE